MSSFSYAPEDELDPFSGLSREGGETEKEVGSGYQHSVSHN